MSPRAVLGSWALLASLMSVNGIVRETVLARAFSRGVADLLSAILGITIIIATTGALFPASQRGATPGRCASR